ncbi:MAG: dihydrolipoyl dehydrogenase [Hydrogenophilales bacterium CG17_big_fil_post_rev_8_21_14_2_50_63_12]|nr:MAG: dihydrolipoyl dehydrogenase [Hydrogenophilales bacterium CG17_big_fil_post_rev_8_21_14_2_50_63_12]PIX98257.1 MAG: dihydrolipoyl dehydrogenase [Hydrogenophilales bacterium CG_4_10_14_3_um_filter_63_21]
MSQPIEIKVPDIGSFKDVQIIDILVNPGDSLAKDASLITVESDKAAMDIPCPQAGVVEKLLVKVGDKVSEGTPLLLLKTSLQSTVGSQQQNPEPPAAQAPLATQSQSDLHAQVLVLGAGPGGYTAAFRAADLGLQVVLVERYPDLGGVCLNVGCIPSKALLHTARLITEAEEMAAHGVSFGKPHIDLAQLREWKAHGVVAKLTSGLGALANQRKVTVARGVAQFTGPNSLQVTAPDGTTQNIGFDNAIIAAGSQPIKLPFQPDDPRVMDSTGALALEDVPARLLIIGGGIIGLEMGTVYDALGSRVSVVERGSALIPGCDPDLVRPLAKRMEKRFEQILLNTGVAGMEAKDDGIHVNLQMADKTETQIFDRVLVAIGRRPNGKLIGAEAAGVVVNEQGFIPVDKQMRTNVPHIHAIGDIIGQPMLAHKAVHEGKIAAEVIAGHNVEFQALVIPSVAYTDPEVAWVGVTESEAKAHGLAIEKGAFPWAASGRALSIARGEGLTKLILDKASGRVIGAGIVGINAGELLAEAVLAIEMGATAEDIGLTIHAHPTLSETLCFAAEMAEGTITDLLPPKKK